MTTTTTDVSYNNDNNIKGNENSNTFYLEVPFRALKVCLMLKSQDDPLFFYHGCKMQQKRL